MDINLNSAACDRIEAGFTPDQVTECNAGDLITEPSSTHCWCCMCGRDARNEPRLAYPAADPQVCLPCAIEHDMHGLQAAEADQLLQLAVEVERKRLAASKAEPVTWAVKCYADGELIRTEHVRTPDEDSAMDLPTDTELDGMQAVMTARHEDDVRIVREAVERGQAALDALPVLRQYLQQGANSGAFKACALPVSNVLRLVDGILAGQPAAEPSDALKALSKLEYEASNYAEMCGDDDLNDAIAAAQGVLARSGQWVAAAEAEYPEGICRNCEASLGDEDQDDKFCWQCLELCTCERHGWHGAGHTGSCALHQMDPA